MLGSLVPTLLPLTLEHFGASGALIGLVVGSVPGGDEFRDEPDPLHGQRPDPDAPGQADSVPALRNAVRDVFPDPDRMDFADHRVRTCEPLSRSGHQYARRAADLHIFGGVPVLQPDRRIDLLLHLRRCDSAPVHRAFHGGAEPGRNRRRIPVQLFRDAVYHRLCPGGFHRHRAAVSGLLSADVLFCEGGRISAAQSGAAAGGPAAETAGGVDRHLFPGSATATGSSRSCSSEPH